MDKTIYDLMSGSEKKVDEFKLACDNLLASQYILADIKITAVLESIAVSKILINLFNEILKDFDYKGTARDFVSGNFKLPSEPKVIAALVFCVLLDMDKKIIGLNDFLDLMHKGDVNTGYEMFLEKVASPFKNSVLYLLSVKRDRHLEEQAVIKQINADEKEKISFEKTLNIFLTRIHTDESLDEIEKDEILKFGNNLLLAKEQDNELLFQNVYTKLHKKVKQYKPSLLPEFENLI